MNPTPPQSPDAVKVMQEIGALREMLARDIDREGAFSSFMIRAGLLADLLDEIEAHRLSSSPSGIGAGEALEALLNSCGARGRYHALEYADAVEAAEKVLRSQSRMGEGWQDIASAPKDGSTIIGLSYFTNGDVSSINLVQWITAAEIAEIEGGSPDEFRDGWDCEGDEVSPLFWMPFKLPAPPSPTPKEQ